MTLIGLLALLWKPSQSYRKAQFASLGRTELQICFHLSPAFFFGLLTARKKGSTIIIPSPPEPQHLYPDTAALQWFPTPFIPLFSQSQSSCMARGSMDHNRLVI